MDAQFDALVVGAGVIGLTTAVVLAEAGYRTRIQTKQPFTATTSANSGAIWGPFLSALDDRVMRWSYETLDALAGLSGSPDSGIAMATGLYASDFDAPPPDWILRLEGTWQCEVTDLMRPYVCGWWYRVPIIDMPKYLGYLNTRYEEAGGTTEASEVRVLDDLVAECVAKHIILCTGIGSRDLANDRLLVPSKGELVVVSNPGITEFFAERGDGPDLTYILPQGRQVVLGGTAEWMFESEDADPHTAAAIIARCATVEPKLVDAQVLGHRVGIRPHRPTVRLEHELRSGGQHLIYNYGHGGSGVSVSWGCAYAAQRLMDSCGGG